MAEYLSKNVKSTIGKENFFLIAAALIFIAIEPFNSNSLFTTFFDIALAISISSVLTAVFYA